MKITRAQLRKLLLKEAAGSITRAMTIVENMAEEIEESHGGLDTDEAAEELVRRLDDAGSFDVEEILAEMLLDAILELRAITRR